MTRARAIAISCLLLAALGVGWLFTPRGQMALAVFQYRISDEAVFAFGVFREHATAKDLPRLLRLARAHPGDGSDLREVVCAKISRLSLDSFLAMLERETADPPTINWMLFHRCMDPNGHLVELEETRGPISEQEMARMLVLLDLCLAAGEHSCLLWFERWQRVADPARLRAQLEAKLDRADNDSVLLLMSKTGDVDASIALADRRSRWFPSSLLGLAILGLARSAELLAKTEEYLASRPPDADAWDVLATLCARVRPAGLEALLQRFLEHAPPGSAAAEYALDALARGTE